MGKVKKEILNERRQKILRIVVQEYILTGQPVASGHLVSKYELNVSSATVRNDLAYLEEHGFLAQPHLSAGRVPTDKGYRFYVENVIDKSIITDEEKGFVEEALRKSRSGTENLYLEAARLAARLTRCFGLTVATSSQNLKIILFELLKLAKNRLLVMLVTENGNVYPREVEIFDDLSEKVIEYVRNRVKREVTGKNIADIHRLSSLTGPEEHEDVASAYLYNRIVSELKKILNELIGDSKIYIDVEAPDWLESLMIKPEIVSKIYNLSHQKEIVSRLVEEALALNKIVVKIGQENPIASDFSVVVAPYSTKALSGVVGVIGPKRMNYIRAVSAAKFISGQLSELLSSCF